MFFFSCYYIAHFLTLYVVLMFPFAIEYSRFFFLLWHPAALFRRGRSRFLNRGRSENETLVEGTWSETQRKPLQPLQQSSPNHRHGSAHKKKQHSTMADGTFSSDFSLQQRISSTGIGFGLFGSHSSSSSSSSSPPIIHVQPLSLFVTEAMREQDGSQLDLR